MEDKPLERILADFQEHLNTIKQFPEMKGIYSVLERNLDRPLNKEEHAQITRLYAQVCYKDRKNPELDEAMKERAEYDLCLIKDELKQLPKPEEFEFSSFWKRRTSKRELKGIIKKLRQYQKLCELNGKTKNYISLECNRNSDEYEWRLRLTEIHGGVTNTIHDFVDWCKKRI